MVIGWFTAAFKGRPKTGRKDVERTERAGRSNCWALPIHVAEARLSTLAAASNLILRGSATLYRWNRPRVGPFEIRIRYQSVEEPPVRVLVVEDDPLVRELVVEALREEGYEVIHAANGEQALAWCQRRIADVLVTDIMLPGQVDGWQIAELCREHDPGLPVIYATGFSPVEARPVPGSLTLQKPCQPDRIVKAVRQMRRQRP